LMILMVSCVVLRLKPVLHHFKLAGSSRDHWLMPWDVPIASLWDHTALSPSSCLRVTPQKKRTKQNCCQTFELISYDFIISCPSESERAQYNAVGRTSLKDTCESILHLESAQEMLVPLLHRFLCQVGSLLPFVFKESIYWN
jgi:hypothetical protein